MTNVNFCSGVGGGGVKNLEFNESGRQETKNEEFLAVGEACMALDLF